MVSEFLSAPTTICYPLPPRPPARLWQRFSRISCHMPITPTPLTAAIAGVFAGVAMPLIWSKLGDETLNWVFAFLLVIALPMHVLVVGFNPPREAGQGGSNSALIKRVAVWLAAAMAAVALTRILSL